MRQPPPETVAAMPALLSEFCVPGVSVAVIEKARVTWAQGFGVRSAESREPVTEATIFEAASLSKPVFAYRVLKLCELNVLELDAPLAGYLPEPYVADEPRVARITARMVLSHTTGFPNWRPHKKPLALLQDPGETFGYSGEGFVYLQRVVEHLTRELIAGHLRKNLLDPIGMRRSSYVWLPEYEKSAAQGHDRQGEPSPKDKPAIGNVAWSLHTTSTEYAALVCRLLHGRRKDRVHLDTDSIAATCTVQPHTDPVHPWGLGWGLHGSGETLSLWHWGDNGVFKCFVVAFPKRQSGVVVMTNGQNGLRLIRKLLPTLLGQEYPAFGWAMVDA